MSFENLRNAIVSPALKAVADHWGTVRATGKMPAWEQLRPSQVAGQLSIIWAYKYDRDTGRFTGRLAGDRITRGFGKNFRGLAMQDVHPPEVFDWVQRSMTRIVLEPVLYRCTGPLFRHGAHVVEGERIMLPLAGDGAHGDGVLGVSDYVYPQLGTQKGPVELLSEKEEWFPLMPVSPARETATDASA